METDHQSQAFREIAEAALSNAESLLEDATFLEGKGKCGHAFALTVLADEEIAKAKVLLIASLGFASTKLSGKTLRIGEKVLELFRKHKEKQIIQFAVRWFTGFIAPILDSIVDALRSDQDGMKRALDMAEEHMKSITRDKSKLEAFVKPLLEFSQIQLERDRGLYVDIQNGKLSRPSEFPPNRCTEFIQVIQSEVEETRKLLKLGEVGELMKEFLQLSDNVLGRRDVRRFMREHGGGLMLKKARREIKKISKA